MTLVLRWRVPERHVATRWRGPEGMVGALARDPLFPVAAIVGPPGPPGPPGPNSSPLRIDASLAATWILAHPLGRVPMVQVYLAPGERILADVAADSTQITVSFASPQQGFVLAF
jgi:hypothetical protein